MYLKSAYNTFSGHGTGNLYITGTDTVFIKGDFYPNPHDFTISNYQKSSKNYIESSNLDNRYIYNINIPFEDGIEIKTENTNVFIDGDIPIRLSYWIPVLIQYGSLFFFVIIFTTPPIEPEPYNVDIAPSITSILSTLDKPSIEKSILPAYSPETLSPSTKKIKYLLSRP